MYEAWIEYIDSNNENKKKLVGKITSIEDLISKIFSDEYIQEYIYMPEAIIVIRQEDLIIDRYITKKTKDNRIFLLSIDKLKEIFNL